MIRIKQELLPACGQSEISRKMCFLLISCLIPVELSRKIPYGQLQIEQMFQFSAAVICVNQYDDLFSFCPYQ